MSDKDVKKVTEKADESKFEGLKIVDKKDNINPNKKVKKEKDKVYTSPVKIGNVEYIIKPLSMLDIKKLNIKKKELKDGDDTATYDFSFETMLTVVQKFNPEAKHLSVEQFEDMITLDVFEEVQAAVLQISGLRKFFRSGVSRK